MIYPNNFEQKIGFDEIRGLLKARCLSTLGKEKVDEIAFSTDASVVNEWLSQVREFRRLQEEKDDFPMQYFFDVRESIKRIRLENTHLEEDEVWDLRRSLQTIADIVRYLGGKEERVKRKENTSDYEGAEREGFEPPVPLGTVVFKTTVIDHSTISPVLRLSESGCKGTNFSEK